MIEDGLYFAREVPDDDDVDDDDADHDGRFNGEDDDAGLSLKSGGQSLSEDFLVVTRRPAKDANDGTGDASDYSVSDSGLERAGEGAVAGASDDAVHGKTESFAATTATMMSEATASKDDSGLLGSNESPPSPPPPAHVQSSNPKASLKAPRKRMNGGGGGRDRSASPLCLPKEDRHSPHPPRGGKEDRLLDAETQSLSSLCVEPPLSINDNLEDRMDDLSLDEEDMEEMRVETLEEELGVEDCPTFSSNIPESVKTTHENFPGSNDTGEDALLDEIDQVGMFLHVSRRKGRMVRNRYQRESVLAECERFDLG